MHPERRSAANGTPPYIAVLPVAMRIDISNCESIFFWAGVRDAFSIWSVWICVSTVFGNGASTANADETAKSARTETTRVAGREVVRSDEMHAAAQRMNRFIPVP